MRMCAGLFELQVQRGLAYVLDDMPRVVESRIRVARAAEETWKLRCNFELEQKIAALTNRNLTMIEENTVHHGEEDEQTQRLVRCELVGEHLGGAMMGAVTSKDLASEVSSSFYVRRFDEDHGSSFVVEMLKVRIDVFIKGHQWCLPETETSCLLCTRIELSVRVPGVGYLVEMKLERQLRASHAAFPGHADAFVKQLEDAKVRNRLVASPPSSPDPELSRLPAHAAAQPSLVAMPLPEHLARRAEAPRLNRWKVLWALWFGIGLKACRRHHVLPSNGSAHSAEAAPIGRGAEMVTVQMGRRSARWLVLCGCASVEQDEIVE